jgi:flavin reductase (DIM6/NTAB) family NADH-FMN oxidoreductase RutF
VRVLDTGALDRRARYQLLTSLVVPRPIAWVSTRAADGTANLAPFSYFAAVSATPFLVSISIGHRGDAPKDSLRNIEETGAFCVSFADAAHLEAMNLTAGEYAPDVDEFALAAVPLAEAESVAAPYVADAAAVLECRTFQVVPLAGSANTLVLGEVLRVRLRGDVEMRPGTHFVDSAALRPVSRLWGDLYAELGPVTELPRPR